MIMDMLSLHELMNDKNNSLIYSGPLWSENISAIAETLKKRMEYDGVPPHMLQKVFSVFIEQLNNMLMYSAEKTHIEFDNGKDVDFSKGTYILGKDSKIFFLQTGNVMKNEYVELVKNRIDHLNALDRNGIREYYKEQMKLENKNPGSKGAGLGFIEIARRINSKIDYSFVPYREGLTFFTFYVTIGDENDKQ